jgi:hypothetical protein
MTTPHYRSELAAVVQRTIRSRPLGDIAELALAIVDDIEDAGWTIAKADAVPSREGRSADVIANKALPPIREKRSVLPIFSRRVVPKPIVVTVPHRLSREEAKRRLADGLQHVAEQIASAHASLDYGWEGYRINFSVTAMRQRLDGHTDVEDEFIRISIHLPFLLRMLADPIASRVESDTELLLTKSAT